MLVRLLPCIVNWISSSKYYVHFWINPISPIIRNRLNLGILILVHTAITDWILCSTGRDPLGSWTSKDKEWKNYATNSAENCS